jgi:hypothetical protein
MHVNVFKAGTVADMVWQPSVMPLLEMFIAEVKYLTILFFSEPLLLNCLKHISFYKSILCWIDQSFESGKRHIQKFLNSLLRLRTQAVQLPTTRCHSNLLSQYSGFAAITCCVPSHWVFIIVHVKWDVWLSDHWCKGT